MSLMFHTGVVESRDDPLRLGRCKVRVVGVHTEDTTLLPASDLPWAFPMQPVNSAAMNGIGFAPVGPVPGTWVIIAFQDEAKQFPIMMGTIGGVPQESLYGQIDIDDGNLVLDPGKSSDIDLRTVPRTIAGQSSITFYDPAGQQTDFTSKLSINMRVSGPGVAEETLIEQIESKDTIRLTKPYGGNGENILTFKPAPTNLDALKESKSGQEDTLNTSGGTNITANNGNVSKAPAPSANATSPTATTQSTTPAETPVSSAVNNAIPTVPPKRYQKNLSVQTASIKAMIAACDKVGLTSKAQKCALLGIAGGESTWQPLFENTSYSEQRFAQIFPSIANKRPEAEWKSYCNWNSSTKGREGFFSYIYGPTTRGKGFFQHTTDAEGGKYYGRGYIQLTGKSNYIRYNNLAKKMGLNIDIVNDPDSLNSDLNVCALVAALYLVDRVPKNTPNDARYFEVAKRAVGINSPDIGARKKEFFEYFYGEKSESVADKEAAPTAPPATESSAGEDANGKVIPSPSAAESRFGFKDPNGKYPLGNMLNEPDTNRLARGLFTGTVVEVKDGLRVLQIPTANGGVWSQPEAPYGGQYPYNKVFETESGHVQEWDDTPGNERITTFHRAGTYSDIDADGTRVDYINGDNYSIMSKNGFVYVYGACNLTVGGQVNILCQSDANIKVEGNSEVTFGGNVDLGVAQNLNMVVGSDFSLKVGGNFEVDVGADFATKVKGKVGLAAEGEIQTSTKGKYGLNVTGDIDVKSDSTSRISSGDAMELKTGGNMRLDYSRGDFGNGANAATPGTPKEPADATALVAPPVGNPLGNSIAPLEGRERTTDKEKAGETEEDINTPEGRKLQDDKQKEAAGKENTSEAGETAPAPSGGAPDPKSKIDCAVIFTSDRFTDSYKLTKNFTLGMCIDGGTGGRHRLQNQTLTDVLQGGKERIYTPQEIVCNLANTVEACLEPLVAGEILPQGMVGYKKSLWGINSGYRLKGVLKAESATSAHCKGQALDIGLRGGDRYKKTYDLVQLVERAIPYDQIILEYDNPASVWIHIGYNYKGGNRRMAFTMSRHSTYQRDAKGYPKGFVLLEPVNGVFPKK
jgi:predicted chitinase